MSYEELERERLATKARLQQLEEQYFRKKENKTSGPMMRENMGYASPEARASGRREEYDDEPGPSYRSSGKKRVTYAEPDEDKENLSDFEDSANEDGRVASSKLGGPHRGTPHRGTPGATDVPSRRTKSKPREEEPIYKISPRRQIFEAKFEKYISNKT